MPPKVKEDEEKTPVVKEEKGIRVFLNTSLVDKKTISLGDLRAVDPEYKGESGLKWTQANWEQFVPAGTSQAVLDLLQGEEALTVDQ